MLNRVRIYRLQDPFFFDQPVVYMKLKILSILSVKCWKTLTFAHLNFYTITVSGTQFGHEFGQKLSFCQISSEIGKQREIITGAGGYCQWSEFGYRSPFCQISSEFGKTQKFFLPNSVPLTVTKRSVWQFSNVLLGECQSCGQRFTKEPLKE